VILGRCAEKQAQAHAAQETQNPSIPRKFPVPGQQADFSLWLFRRVVTGLFGVLPLCI
jgi:hypothetical protein